MKEVKKKKRFLPPHWSIYALLHTVNKFTQQRSTETNKQKNSFSAQSLIILVVIVSHQVMSDSFETLRTAACQAPLSMGFHRQEYWSRCHFFLQGIFPNSHLLHWQADSLTTELLGKRCLMRRENNFTTFTTSFVLIYKELKLWKILKEMGIPDHPYLSPAKAVCRSRNNI